MIHKCATWKLCLFLLATTGFRGLAAAATDTAPATGTTETAAANADEAAKRQILESPAWQQAMVGFNEWLSAQVVYGKEQVPRLKAQLKEKVSKMTAGQLRGFLEDLREKLAILGSKQAIDDRAWAEDYLSHFTVAAGEKFRKTLPDVANMTAAQVKQAVVEMQQRREADAASQTAFDQQRDEQVAAMRERNLLTAEADAQAESPPASFGGSPYSGTYGGGYAPVTYPERYYSPIFPGGYWGGWRW